MKAACRTARRRRSSVEPVESLGPNATLEPGLVWSGPRRAIRDRDVAAEASRQKLDKAAEVRLHLQRSAPANLRHHLRRAAIRLAVLMAGDRVAFGAMRALLRAVRDDELLGSAVAARLHAALPAGMLNGWQYAAALFLGLVVLGNYGPGDQRRDMRRLFAACALATALPLWSTLWTRGVEPMLVQYAVTVVLVSMGLVVERLTIDRIKAWVRPPERDTLDTLFVGPAADCLRAAQSPVFVKGTEFRPIGFVDAHVPPAPGALGYIGDISILLAVSGARVVVVCGYLTDVQFQEVVDAALAGGCQVLSIPRSVEIAGVHPVTVWRHGQPLVEMTEPTLKGWQLFLKRVLDLLVSAIGLLVSAPVFAFIELAIKLDSRGPVIFGHRRLGINGRVLNCYKFRSMHLDAEDLLRSDTALHAQYVSNNFKFPEDAHPLLTRIGRFLRKTSLDELPQLLNVFKGDMSLVSTRPIVPDALTHYGHGAA